ncbi:MAG TPA: hypothetical protein DEA96_12975, partial [Leptospiraceae bacterium]|nr:hypothetical protein [Leptospiraceae bacterium]
MNNRYKVAALAFASLWVFTIGVFAYFFVFGVGRMGPDDREIINVTAGEKQFLLKEMRQLLEATQQIHEALGTGQREQAALAAESVGMGMVQELAAVESTILLKLPVPMKELGLGTHREFDNLARTIRSDASEKQIMKEM